MTKSIKNHLTPDEWEQLLILSIVLDPFHEIQKFMEGDYVTSPFIPFFISKIRNILEDMITSYDLSSNKYPYLNESVKNSIHECVKEMNRILILRFGTGNENSVFVEHMTRGPRQIRKGFPLQVFLAAACDPRTKDLSRIPESDRVKVWDAVLDALLSIDGGGLIEASISTDPTFDVEEKGLDSEGLFSDLCLPTDIRFENQEEDYGIMKEQTITAEINHYRGLKSIQSYMNPLEWWKMNQFTYPHLCKLAKRVLCIPSTSAASERVFSTGGRTITKLRSSLSTDHAADLIFLKGSWATVEEYIINTEDNHISKKQRSE